jgi:hypothetical protein
MQVSYTVTEQEEKESSGECRKDSAQIPNAAHYVNDATVWSLILR